ncbi:hypothetical protein PPACK8108_LOCUS21960 [Phakopsora pachyrhizi]|uniref:Uncharacterized protein n=1 Tax=Phakopsora pachyrhizi TaxID=170000 RepID=A0AAV0BNS1_PHAPC|nr:hypothetical protein PPACK8108_LOCUS21960 [Phakopsora pachyrhizi]
MLLSILYVGILVDLIYVMKRLVWISFLTSFNSPQPSLKCNMLRNVDMGGTYAPIASYVTFSAPLFPSRLKHNGSTAGPMFRLLTGTGVSKATDCPEETLDFSFSDDNQKHPKLLIQRILKGRLSQLYLYIYILFLLLLRRAA